ncbi:MAG: urease accessory protein UreD [Bacillota bacterium]
MPRDGSPVAPQWRARLALAFERRGARTVLARREHEGPLVVQKALYPEGDGICHAIVVHPPGGVAGGDELTLSVDVAGDAQALLTTPGAAKWYRSLGASARQQVSLRVHEGAALEWLPQESIVFDGAIADISLDADLAPRSSLIAWDIVCLGRAASGERYERGECRLRTRVRRGGQLVWFDRAAFRGGDRVLHAPAGLDGHTVFGTMIACLTNDCAPHRASWRECAPAEGEGAISLVDGLLVARYRGDAAEAARRYFAELWARVREPALGVAAVAPRIWST